MKSVASKKAKGRRLQNKVALRLRQLFELVLVEGDIKPTMMSSTGKDIILSPTAMNLIPYDIECKNVENLVSSTMRDAIEQAEENTDENRIPLLIFKSNNEPERIIMRFEDFLNLIYPKGDISYNMNNKEKILLKIEELKQEIIKREKGSGDE